MRRRAILRAVATYAAAVVPGAAAPKSATTAAFARSQDALRAWINSAERATRGIP